MLVILVEKRHYLYSVAKCIIIITLSQRQSDRLAQLYYVRIVLESYYYEHPCPGTLLYSCTHCESDCMTENDDISKYNIQPSRLINSKLLDSCHEKILLCYGTATYISQKCISMCYILCMS